jgi:hypothetical protein
MQGVIFVKFCRWWAEPPGGCVTVVTATSLPVLAGGCVTRPKMLRIFWDSNSTHKQGQALLAEISRKHGQA